MSERAVLFPPRLREGATLALVAPASPPLEPERIPEIVERLRAAGFRVKPGKHLEKRDGYLAGTDADRAADFNSAWIDEEVDGILALRGGYGSCRLLPLLDYPAMRAHPKPFFGYSDNTALHQAILKEAGLVTFHGPNGSEAFLPSNTEYMKRAWFKDEPELFSPAFKNGDKVATLVKGQAQGRLMGGNMTCLVRLLGTPYAPDFAGAILFLEDIGEKAYRVDGMFTQLRLAGAWAQISGLVLGKFSHTDEREQQRIDDCLRREAVAVGLPCVTGAPIGHFPEQIVVPHGARAELDATKKILRRIDS
jgi:muramoyltetrapeptide carboxypeptidase